MKKILTLCVLRFALMFSAMGSTAVVYDFSSSDNFEETVLAQGLKEGFSEEDVEEIFLRYCELIIRVEDEALSRIRVAYLTTHNKTLSELGESDGESILLSFLAEYMQGKSIEEMKVFACPSYDFSSADDFIVSLEAQGLKENFSDVDSNDIFVAYFQLALKEKADAFSKIQAEYLKKKGKRSQDLSDEENIELNLAFISMYMRYKTVKAMKEYVDATKPVYEFAAYDIFEASLESQGAKEGFSKEESLDIFSNYLNVLAGVEMVALGEIRVAYLKKKNKTLDELSEEEAQEIILEFLERYMQGKTLEELKGYIESNRVFYDFSSAEAFDKSSKIQGAKEGFSTVEIEEITAGYMALLKKSKDKDFFGVYLEYMHSKGKALGTITDRESKELDLIFAEKHMQGKTIEEMKEYLKNN